MVSLRQATVPMQPIDVVEAMGITTVPAASTYI